MKKKNAVLTSPLARRPRRTGKRAGEGKRGNTLLSPLIGFECLRTQNHFPRRGGSQTAGGFTLIELLVVVLIIGILAAVAVPQYQKAVEKARAAEGLTILKTIANANRAYYMANGVYATDIDDLDIEIPGTLKPYSIVGNRRETKYFEYGANAYNNDAAIAIAQRLPNSTFYSFDYFGADDIACCYAFSDKGTEICKTLSNGKTNATYSENRVCYQVN